MKLKNRSKEDELDNAYNYHTKKAAEVHKNNPKLQAYHLKRMKELESDMVIAQQTAI